MPPKAADKKPASKAPATASKAPEKKDAGKKTATGEKKKRTKARKETYSSYIYKGKLIQSKSIVPIISRSSIGEERVASRSRHFSPTTFIPTRDQTPFTNIQRVSSPQAGSPRHWYLQPCHVHPELFRQR